MSQVEAAEIDKVRALVIQVAREQQVSDTDAKGARDTIRNICKEASQHGLTAAEVVRALFRPVLETRSRGCKCPTCQARRDRRQQDEMVGAGGLGANSTNSNTIG